MSNAQSEVPFLAGMEREPETSQRVETNCDDTLTRWKLDQLHEKVDRLTIPVREAVHAAMAGLRAAMASRAAEERGPDPDAVDPIESVRGDDGPRIRRERPVPERTDRAIWVSVASLVITVGTILFWTGRFTAQADAVAKTQAEQAAQLRANDAANARQDVTLGIIGTQYAEIARRLGSIESKVDDRH